MALLRTRFIFFFFLFPIRNPSKSKSFSFCLNPRTKFSSSSSSQNANSPVESLPFSDLEDVMTGYVFGKMKAHSVWKRVIQKEKKKGDAVVVDATCGNGHDTLAMLQMLPPPPLRVYAFDIQLTALENTMSLLHYSLDPHQIKHVELFNTCHSRMEEVVPKGINVRLVAFNLGYLPGGDKTLITRSETTILALGAAQRILAPGGLISLVVYVGHPGGIEELERVEGFASGLPVDNWICCKLQMLNKPLAPLLVFIFKK